MIVPRWLLTGPTHEVDMIRLPHRPLRRAACAVALAAICAVLPGVAAAARTATDTTIVAPATWRIEPANPCVDDSVRFVADVCFACGADSILIGERSITVVLSVWPNVDCQVVPCPNIHAVAPLGRLSAGPHDALLRVVLRTMSASGQLLARRVQDLPAHFDVRPTCGGGGLPFVDRVRIGNRPAPCDTCPPVVCTGDTLRVHFEGTLPAPCWHVESVHWLPVMSPIPTLVAVVDVSDSTCSAIPECGRQPTHWSADLFMPPGPWTGRAVTVDVYQRSCRGDSAVRRPVGSRVFPFDLRDCNPVAGCVEATLGIFDDSTGTLPCDVFAGPERLARAPLSVRTHAPLAAMQGRVVGGGTVVSLTPIGPALGWPIVTHPAVDGSGDMEFVLFSVTDAVIPPGTFPVLSALVQLDSTTTMETLIGAIDLASDPQGNAVPICVHVTPEGRAVGICQALADTCDANHDGLTNVRDLVLLARCLRHPDQCSVNTALFDCNHDSQFTIPDLICCARRILHGGGPDSAEVHPADGVAVTFGEPVRGASTLDLPVTLDGADRVGAAVLQLQFPADRYTLEGVTFAERSDWLQLSDGSQPGRVEIGLVSLADGGGTQVPATLRLRLKAGAAHGGEVSVTGYDLSSPAGTRLGGLTTGQAQLGTGGGPAVVALSAPRPNPTGGATRFVVSLPRAADVDLGVYDLAGRRIATLAHARLGAGDTDVSWEARGVRDGVYFARLTVDGRTYASRVTVLRTR